MVGIDKSIQKGFTVIELLVGIALFGVITPAIIVSIVSLGSLNDRSADLTLANTIAENKIESLRSAGYNSLLDGANDFSGELGATFTLPKSATYTISSPEVGIKQIDVVIEYSDRGATRTLEYTSLISELGVAQ